MSHRDTDQPRVDRDLLDQLVREQNGLTPYYINDAERAESKLKGESRSIRMEDFLSWGQCFT